MVDMVGRIGRIDWIVRYVGNIANKGQHWLTLDDFANTGFYCQHWLLLPALANFANTGYRCQQGLTLDGFANPG